MNQMEQVQQHLRDAHDVPAVLSAGWEIFELLRTITAAYAERSADMYPAFTFARGAAVSGRNTIAFAPSMSAMCAEPSGMTTPVATDVYETAGAAAELASALSARLREAGELATDADDRTACEDAALDAEQISMLLAKGE